MELLTYFHVLWHRKQLILITVLVTVIVAVIGRMQVPAKYESSAIIRVVPYSNTNPTNTQLYYADRIMKTYVEIGSGSVVLSNLREDFGLAPNQPALVDIDIIPNTELLRITVTDYDPVLASDVANTLAGYLINDNAIRDVHISLMEPATVPQPASTLSMIIFYVLAVLVGLMGGIGLAFLLENIDPRLYDEKHVEDISTSSVLGYIPSVSGWLVRRVVAGRFPYNHAFHRLAINLQSIIPDNNMQTIMVTSAEPREGKSIVAANLAYSMAQAGFNILLVDANLHRPTIHDYFKLSNETGLSNLLCSEIRLKDIVRGTDLPGLSIITSGSMPENLEGVPLDSEQVTKFLEEFTLQYDYVILDTPAFLGLVDSAILSRLVDGVLLVTRLRATRPYLLKTTYQQLEKVQAKILGLVINETQQKTSVHRYHFPKRKHLLAALLRRRVLFK